MAKLVHPAFLGLQVLLISTAAWAEIIERFFTASVKTLDPTCISPRESVVVNDQWPGPAIYARDGDTVIVHFTNNQSMPITVHWHGITQEGSQWSDGVPAITQCAIPEGSTYTYKFQIKGEIGTFWYHAHVAQLRNTLHGALIVKPSHVQNPEPIPVRLAGDIPILAGDWYTESPQELIDSVSKVPYQGYPLPTALHINGLTLCSGPFVAAVTPRRWYRFRIINTGMWASYNFQIEKHRMYLFEAEGGYLARLRLNKLDVYPGQSYSVLVFTGQKPDNYWMTVSKRFDVEKSTMLPGAAVLSYRAKGVAPGETPDRPFPTPPTLLSDPGFQFRQESYVRSAYPNQELASAQVEKLLVLELNSNTLPGGLVVYSINNVTFGSPSIPFLLADYYGNSSSVYSTAAMPDLPPEGLAAANDGPTNIVPTAIKVPYGAWVQIVFQNHQPPGGLHPWHLHGFNFHVVARGPGRFDASKWQSYKYNLVNPPLRNTVALYDGYWAAIRFQALNPGDWIMHCHNEQHADQGMIVVIKNLPLPNSEQPWLSPPPHDYPSC